MAKIIVYTTERCPKCNKLKKFLEANSVPFEVADMSTPEALTELRFNGVFTVTAPVLQINSEFLTYTEIFHGEEVNPEKLRGIL
ncbi:MULTISPECIES: glutaredoxin family protein [unclassified Methanosarcina]|uniref:glutaredoxin family protein n=1 Tax=unclassified Methanosarcina TaxID=2644672 RepID=UPI00061561F0|nr:MULTISPECIES: glutaredoxin family protein [unclassified Methanosarcina]AKB20219.1 Glutaredoxin-like protein [Methanosarcina sp. WWM596]AKB23415.1 Glutaredoxin-like protein [Methanosarcina sp. WH1]